MTTRAEHIKWAKDRAIELLEAGDWQEAITSMLSDLSKHEETARLGETMAIIGMFEIMNGNDESARRFISSFTVSDKLL